ncbi:L10-interacting MYB domain-containing protein-like [Diospyros lotus]|uniref:L10-interacting MYB domain-containing protein-like n=1 Tax=Diospyros lotus TaxID=55363 RepID=UPI0022568AC3|nr:L10-interacting MYB domain-containing protein-like [Diospyros lotus]
MGGHRGKLQCSTFTKDEWGKINQDMIGLTKMDYGIDRLKGKWNRLRKVHRLFAKLVGHTGVTWDPNTNKVDAAEEVWQHFFTINKAEYKIFKKEGCKHYAVLGEIFGGTTAIGGLGNASTQLPPTSEEERQIEDDFLNRGMHVRAQQNDDEYDEVTISMRSEETELRMLYLKEKLAHMQGKSSIQSSNSEATSPDPYSTKVCLDILNSMEGVSNEDYMKAMKAFKDPDFRMSFVEMLEIRRGPILNLL